MMIIKFVVLLDVLIVDYKLFFENVSRKLERHGNGKIFPMLERENISVLKKDGYCAFYVLIYRFCQYETS